MTNTSAAGELFRRRLKSANRLRGLHDCGKMDSALLSLRSSAPDRRRSWLASLSGLSTTARHEFAAGRIIRPIADAPHQPRRETCGALRQAQLLWISI